MTKQRATRFPPGPLLRDVGELDDVEVRVDPVKRVATARVVFVDHDVLRHDFPWLADDAHVREEWLLAHAGVISATQAKQTATNTRIRVTGPKRDVWRPANYGRACVVPAYAHHYGEGAHRGLIDVKGTGVVEGMTPALRHHSSGLCSLGELLREVLFQKLINEIFVRAAPWFWSLPVYGVIDLGFDARDRHGGRSPAGILVRRAHQRPPGGIQMPWKSSVHERTQVAIELLLRNYGVTSANRGTRFRFENGAGGVNVFYAGDAVDLSDKERKTVARWLRRATLPLECDGMNIQMTRKIAARGRVRAQLLDFDNFEMRSVFHEPVVSLTCDQLLRWSVPIWPDEPGFVQPHPDLVLDEEKWAFGDLHGAPRPRRADGERPFLLAHDLAARFRSGKLTGEQVRNALDESIADGTRHW